MAINNPLIPGDPYSYDLKWIVDKLKEAIALYQPLNEKFDNLSADFDSLSDDFTNLREYVDNYFANLDITQEVSDKIEQMKADGYFDALIAEIIAESGDLQQAVTDWLTENVNPVGSAVTVDSSLTISGAAADAKVTGDTFDQFAAGNFVEFFDKINVICGNYREGYYVPYNTGRPSGLTGWGYYEKVPVQGGQYYNAKNTNMHVAFFTDGGIFINGVANATGSFRAPDNAAYLTYSIPVTSNTEQWIVRSTDQALGYVPNENGLLSQNIKLKADHFTEFFKIGRNLYNKHETITGASFSYEDGLSRMTALSSYHFTPSYIPCDPDTVYTWNYPCIIAEYDNDHNPINVYNRTLLTDARTITTSANAKYLRFSIPNNYWESYMCVKGANVEHYQDFSLIERYPERIITVKKDGSGDYDTITEAVKNAPPNAPIYVYDGVYNESVTEAKYKPVRLIGSGKNCILTYSGLDYNAPPLFISNGYVSNMQIIATNSGTAGANKAYCVHIENDRSINGSLVFENVTFINEVHQCVGIGMRANFRLVFNNCEFISNGSNAFYAHDWETDEEYRSGQELILNNCTFKTTTNFTPIRLQSQELETGVASVTFKNNKAVRGGSGEIIEMGLWDGRTLTNRNYLGSSDWVLNEFSFNNYNDILNA